MERHSALKGVVSASDQVKQFLGFIGHCAMDGDGRRDVNHNAPPKGVHSPSTWHLTASRQAKHCKNYIRSIVEDMKLNPNPDKSVIALSIGDPCVYGNLGGSPVAAEALAEAAVAGVHNGYAACAGQQAAREAVVTYVGGGGDPRDVILCSGCSQALDLCLSVLADPTAGHNVLVPRPGFPLYRTIAEANQVEVRFYALRPEQRWLVDLDDLERQIDTRTAAIVLNNPSNPCGSVYPAEHLRAIIQIAAKHRVPIIADEIYERLVFPVGAEEDQQDHRRFISVAELATDVPVLICGGLAKRFLVPGWRLGWVLLHDPLGAFEPEIRAGLLALAARIMGSNTLVQAALPKLLLETPQSYHDHLINTLYENAKICYDALAAVPGLRPSMPEGAMYMMVEIEKQHFPTFHVTIDFIQKLMEEESVFCLPGECFGLPFFMRIVITPPQDILREACNRMAEFCARYYT